MSRIYPTVVVFDFDGTLVASNQLKYDAYFELFPKDARHRRAIEEVLSRRYEESRFAVLDAILDAVQVKPVPRAVRLESVNRLADAYGRIVTDGAKTCPERDGAGDLLHELAAKIPLYLASTTPEGSLHAILTHRGWIHLFRQVYGHPRDKPGVLHEIARRECVAPDAVLLIGDGTSDRLAAEAVGCRFFAVKPDTTVAAIRGAVGFPPAEQPSGVPLRSNGDSANV